MRWKTVTEPRIGDTRIVRRFLFIPLTLGNETRWLEWAWIKQEYDSRRSVSVGASVPIDIAYWRNIDWADDPTPRTVQGYIRSIKWPKPGGVNQKPEGPRPTPPPPLPITAAVPQR